ncbi:MAG: methyltransferase family protein [Candidatus Hodarchaeota archaeon]
MKSRIKKLLGVPLLVMFMNLGFILFAGEVYTNFSRLIPIVLLNVIISIDIVIRPTSAKRDEYRRSILLISFLFLPIILFLPYQEFRIYSYQHLTPSIYNLTVITGTVLLFLGGNLLIISRIQLGKYGGPRIVIEESHQLITNGVYRFIRHPMYLGFLFIFFGYSLALGSIFMTIAICIFFFFIFKNRIDLEEKMLISEFGNKYIDYMKRTSKLIPFLY